jgi:hypothetical protein
MRKTSKRNWICIYRNKHADKTNPYFFGSAVRKWRGSKLPCMVSPSP